MELTVWGRNLLKILEKTHEKYNLQLLETRVEIKDRIWSPLAGLSQRCTPAAPGLWIPKFQAGRAAVCLSAHCWHLPAAGDVTKGQAGPSPHLSTHAPGATGAGTTARGNIPAHPGPSLKEQSLFVLRVWQKGWNIPDVTSRPDRTPYKQSPLHIKKALKHQSESSPAQLKNTLPNPKNKRISNVWDSQTLNT